MKSLGKNYIPGSMGFGEGFTAGLFQTKGNVGYFMEFSDEKAKEIASLLNIEDIEEIVAGLDGDFMENNCVIYKDGKWTPYSAWHGSIWAKPIILVKFKNAPMEAFECWEKKEYTTIV